MLSGDAVSEDNWMTSIVITTFDWLNDVIELRHNAIATSASSDKTAFLFHLFVSLYTL